MSKRTAALLVYSALIIGAVLALFPLAWMVSASLMPAGEANTYPPRLLPSAPTLEHYRTMFVRLDLARYFMKSALIAVTVAALALFINSMAGYAFAKVHFRRRDTVFQVLVSWLVSPAE